MSSRLNEAIAVSRQYFDELTNLAPLSEIENGNLSEGAKRKKIEWLLERLDGKISEIQGALLSIKVKADDVAPLLTLPAPHAKFLREQLLPHSKLLQTAYLKASGSEILLSLLEDIDTESSRPVWSAIRFTAEYAGLMLEGEDERRWEVEIVEDVLDEPWFHPDRWRNNFRPLRPILIGHSESSIPPSIRFRLTEVYRAFTFGTWMAAIALGRATVEFALISRAPHFGFLPVRRNKYLMLNDLINRAIPKLPSLKASLITIEEAGNRVLHPKKDQNIIPSPKILRPEALACVRATTHVVEELYAE